MNIKTYYIFFFLRNFRNRLILELAINVNGLISSIHPNIIQRLNEDEKKELQRYCEVCINQKKNNNNNRYSFILYDYYLSWFCGLLN